MDLCKFIRRIPKNGQFRLAHNCTGGHFQSNYRNLNKFKFSTLFAQVAAMDRQWTMCIANQETKINFTLTKRWADPLQGGGGLLTLIKGSFIQQIRTKREIAQRKENAVHSTTAQQFKGEIYKKKKKIFTVAALSRESTSDPNDDGHADGFGIHS